MGRFCEAALPELPGGSGALRALPVLTCLRLSVAADLEELPASWCHALAPSLQVGLGLLGAGGLTGCGPRWLTLLATADSLSHTATCKLRNGRSHSLAPSLPPFLCSAWRWRTATG